MSVPRAIARWVLGAFLLFTGIGHLTFARASFVAQVPAWLPLPVDFVVLASGVVEIALGLALLVWARQRVLVGWVTAAFFVAIFPGNVEQFVSGTDAFGLDTDLSRGIRLLFQPLLVIWALWCTGAWRAWRSRRQRRTDSPVDRPAGDAPAR
ncbi:hypothetical protein H9651_09655 [Microbacterium sp. Sa4CUA7]|uniref:DoxX family membrane protein n=1 Tax=Microbacterium pullorum TaxID=2762236 RepID=A0ABR8S342_9MICO|nr:hypothetical protein [Microbacterium pullorum]MBD7957901.1 hypothetical protein [Microbacterium pullorum]